MGNLVADDYNLDIDTCWTEGPCQYTMLDKDKFSFSIYTDLNDDGEVEVNDVTMLINFILGKITI